MNFGELKAPLSSLRYELAASADRGLNPPRGSSLTPDSEEFLPNYWINYALEKQKSVKLWWALVSETACPLIGCLLCTSTHCCWQHDSKYYHGNQAKIWSDLNRGTIRKRKGFQNAGLSAASLAGLWPLGLSAAVCCLELVWILKLPPLCCGVIAERGCAVFLKFSDIPLWVGNAGFLSCPISCCGSWTIKQRGFLNGACINSAVTARLCHTHSHT